MVLSDPSEYEGGQFQMQTGSPEEDKLMTVEQLKGRVIGFPSFLLHRVTPVTKGTRKSLVIWVEGPKFK
jgi:PKHD-type hydroxylase